MPELYKFGWLPDGEHEEPYEYLDVWAREKTSGPDRLVIAPRSHYIRLSLALAKCLEEPFTILYVLTLPRGGGEAGRYQSKDFFTFDEVEYFLYLHQELLEQDARNSIWIYSETGLLVFDRHNVIYAYGPLDALQNTLLTSGLSEVSGIRFPFPHVHRYHFQFDDDELRLLQEKEWIHSPLHPGDENPNDN
jgi:hypothetical protein